MLSSFAGFLATPTAAIIALACFLVSGGFLVFRRNTLSRGWKAVLIVLLVISVLYLLFALWLVTGFGSNPGHAHEPTPTLNG